MPKARDSQKRPRASQGGLLEDVVLLQNWPSITFPRMVQTSGSKPFPSESHTEGAVPKCPTGRPGPAVTSDQPPPAPNPQLTGPL